jgi:hypothetical protein
MTKQAQPRAAEASADAFPMFAFTAPADIESLMSRYSAWLEDLGRVQQESLDFLRERLTRDAEAAARMADCKTPADLFEWQFGYTKEAVEDYVRQGRKITALLMQSNGNGPEGRGKSA